MARWLQDVETGEFYPADSLNPNDYEVVPSEQPQQSTPEYQFPEWFTNMPVVGSVPARALGSINRGTAGLGRMLGEGISNIPGYEDNAILRGASSLDKQAEDLVNQARADSGAEPGSFQDMAAGVAGEILATAPVLAGSIGLQGLKAAAAAPSLLQRLYMAAAPAVLPSGSKYDMLRDEGVSPGDAALASGQSLATNAALNLFDVASFLKPGSFTKRIAPMMGVGAATNAAGAYTDALIDKGAGAAQTPEEFFTNLGMGAATGAGTGAVMSMLRPRSRSANAPESNVDPLASFVDDSAAPQETLMLPPPPEPPAPPPAPPEGPRALPDPLYTNQGYQQGDNFAFRDYYSTPPAVIESRSPLSMVPQPLDNFRFYTDLLSQDAPVVPESQALLDYQPPMSEMPGWDLLPGYQRGDNFQFAPGGNLPAVVEAPRSPLSMYPETLDGFTYRGLDGSSAPIGKAARPALEWDGKTKADVAEADAQVAANPVQKVGEGDSFPTAPKAPAQQSRPQSLLLGDSAPTGGTVDVPVYSTQDVQAIARNAAVVEAPLNKIKLSQDIPQWKSGANENGVTYELQGPVSRQDVGPVQIMERLNGDLEVFSGRHRTDKFRRDGQATIPAQIYREADGFTVEMAKTLDRELNIRDGKGSLDDFAEFFKAQKSFLTDKIAAERGLLNDPKGVMGYNLGTKATPNLWAGWKNGDIKPEYASLIAETVPNDEKLQQNGIKLALQKEPLKVIKNALEGYRDFEPFDAIAGDQTGFPFEEGLLEKLMLEEARVAVDLQRGLADYRRAVESAAKNPEAAQAGGIGFEADPKAILQRSNQLKGEQMRLEKWRLFPDLKELVKTEALRRVKTGESDGRSIAQKIAEKYGRPVSTEEVLGPIPGKKKAKTRKVAGVEVNTQRGAVENPFTWLREYLDKRKGNLPDYQDLSESNKRYGGTYGSSIEWMDTTYEKNPEARNFINAYWQMPQMRNAIVHDAKLTLDPYFGLSDQDRVAVDDYLSKARVYTSKKNPAYQITLKSAMDNKLSQQQAEAAVAVNRWSKDMLGQLEQDALEAVDHQAYLETQKAQTDPRRKAIETVRRKKSDEIKARFDELRAANYVPFNRFGEHYLNVFDADGNLTHRMQFENKTDPNYTAAVKHYEAIAKANGGKIEYGRQAPSRLVQNDQVGTDILAAIGQDDSGIEVQGFHKHLLKADLIPGFELDLSRGISEYTVGAANLLSMRRAKRVAERELATSLKGNDKNNLANKLRLWAGNFENKDSGLFQLINKAANVSYIGGNLRTPTADMLGRIQLQYPLLAKYLHGLEPEKVWGKGIATEMKWWFSDAASFAKQYPDLAQGIAQAQRKGIIPTNIYKTFLRRSKGRAKGAARMLDTVHDLYFGLKEISERSTDLGGFILGWETFNRMPEQTRAGLDQQTFAENFVRESRAVPTQGELPPNPAFKSELGRLATKYRMYQVKILKSLTQANRGQWARYLMATGFTTGLMGLPLMRDSISLGQFFGYEPEDKMREKGAGRKALYGPASAITGIDFSGSAGFGEVFPGSGQNMLSKFALGIAGAPAEEFMRMKNYAERGQYAKAAASVPFMPNPVRNVLTGSDWMNRGVVTLGGDAIIPRDQVTMRDVLKKMAGYQPLAVKEGMAANTREKRAEAKAKDNQFFNQRIGEAEGLEDYATAAELRNEAASKGIRLDLNSIQRYRRAIRGEARRPSRRAAEEVSRVRDLWK